MIIDYILLDFPFSEFIISMCKVIFSKVAVYKEKI